MTDKITMNREYQTRDGRKVTLYCTDAPGPYPVHGRIEDLNLPRSWTAEGILQGSGGGVGGDIIPAPQTWWVNVYNTQCIGPFHNKSEADYNDASCCRFGTRIACVKVTEGDGL